MCQMISIDMLKKAILSFKCTSNTEFLYNEDFDMSQVSSLNFEFFSKIHGFNFLHKI